jgi:hypothetical protein
MHLHLLSEKVWNWHEACVPMRCFAAGIYLFVASVFIYLNKHFRSDGLALASCKCSNRQGNVM